MVPGSNCIHLLLWKILREFNILFHYLKTAHVDLRREWLESFRAGSGDIDVTAQLRVPASKIEIIHGNRLQQGADRCFIADHTSVDIIDEETACR